MEDAKAEKKAVTGPVVGMGGNPAAGQGTLDGAGTGFECEWRAGVMMGKVEKVWYRQYENGKVLVGEDASTTAGYIDTLNRHTGRLPRVEATRRYDVSAGGRRYEFPESKGGFNSSLVPKYREHSPRTKAMLSKGVSVVSKVVVSSPRAAFPVSDFFCVGFQYKDHELMQGWGDFAEARTLDEEIYHGDTKMCLDGESKRHGKGEAKWGFKQCEVYSGDWLMDQKHGKGERRWSHGDVYNGLWVHDLVCLCLHDAQHCSLLNLVR